MIVGCGLIQLLMLGGRTKDLTIGQMAIILAFKLAGGDILNDPYGAREKNPGCQRRSGRNSGALPSLLSQNPCDSKTEERSLNLFWYFVRSPYCYYFPIYRL